MFKRLKNIYWILTEEIVICHKPKDNNLNQIESIAYKICLVIYFTHILNLYLCYKNAFNIVKKTLNVYE